MGEDRPGKGIRGSIRRASLLPSRYGLGSARIRARLRQMASLLARWESIATVPVTAVALEHHPEVAQDLRPFDIGVHGYRHVPYDELTREGQAGDLDRARETFSRHDLTPRGFRAPYLRAGEATRDLLRSRGFLWDSSAPKFFLPSTHAVASGARRLVGTRYRSVSGPPARPGTSQPVDLPIALPDDEILVDGLGITNGASPIRIYEAMLREAETSGSLLALQVHPERFRLCAEAIEALLERARDIGAWIASLSEIAEWGLNSGPGPWPRSHSMAVAITGDLDAIVLGDFVRRVVGE